MPWQSHYPANQGMHGSGRQQARADHKPARIPSHGLAAKWLAVIEDLHEFLREDFGRGGFRYGRAPRRLDILVQLTIGSMMVRIVWRFLSNDRSSERACYEDRHTDAKGPDLCRQGFGPTLQRAF